MHKLAIGMIVLGLAAASAQAQVLTGAVWYTTNGSKQFSGGYANTYGGDTYSRNLYMSMDQSVGSGALLNSQNLTTVPTRIQVNLSTPGTYTFQMYCNDESTANNPFWGLNLFFDNNDTMPLVSAWNVVNAGGFQSVNPIGTPTLNPLTMGLVQQNSGGGFDTTVATIGGNRVQLMSYSTWSTNHYNSDRVDNFSDLGGLGNGTKDNVIEFSLRVQPVPEPASILGFGSLAVGFFTRRRLRRRQS